MRPTALIPITLIAVLVCVVMAPTTPADDLFLTTHPGYADLSPFEGTLGGEITKNFEFDRVSLNALAELARQENPALAELVRTVESVRGRAYRLDGGTSDAVRESIDTTAAALKSGGWNTLVSVKQKDDERVEVLLKYEGEKIQGLTALFADADEAGFASIIGEIEMAQVMTQLSNLGSLRTVLDQMTNTGLLLEQ